MTRFSSHSTVLQVLIFLGLLFFLGWDSECFAQKKRPKLAPIPTKDFVGRILLLPLDARFVSTKLPRAYARIADHDVIYPSREILLNENQLLEWVKAQDLSKFKGVIIGFAAGQEAQRIEVITWLRQQKTALPIYGFSNKSTDALSKIVFDDLVIDEVCDDCPKLLIAAFLNRTYQNFPKISVRISGEIPKTVKASLAKQSEATGVKIVASGKSDFFLFILTDTADEAKFASFVDVLTRTVAAGYYVALVDVSGNPDRIISQLRERKLLDVLNGYAASRLADTAFANVLTQISARFISAKVLRLLMGVDQLQRCERSHIEVMLMRYIEDWGYASVVKPKLEIYLQQPNLSPEMIEEFVKNNLQTLGNELFEKQFRRNIHSILLPSGQRAPFLVAILQRLSVRLAEPPKINEIEVEIGIYLPQMETIEMPANIK